MSAATITIGRNVGDTPMSAASWLAFRATITRTLASIGAETWVDGATYTGAWDGVSEDAAVWLAQLPTGADTGALRATLASVAGAFDQDAVGLVLGEPELVGRRVVTA